MYELPFDPAIGTLMVETYDSQSAFKAYMQQSWTKRVIGERSEGLQAFSRHCLFPNRSVNFAQEFHHLDGLSEIQEGMHT